MDYHSGPQGRHSDCRWREPPVDSPKKHKRPEGPTQLSLVCKPVSKSPVNHRSSEKYGEFIGYDHSLLEGDCLPSGYKIVQENNPSPVMRSTQRFSFGSPYCLTFPSYSVLNLDQSQ